jgi:lactoylglutathione lyase
MKLDHVAIWAVDIERMRTFYEKYFDGRSNLKYENERKGFTSLGVELGSPAAVDALTKQLQGDGFPLLDGPRRTGDGYYESMIADPEGNRIVIAE